MSSGGRGEARGGGRSYRGSGEKRRGAQGKGGGGSRYNKSEGQQSQRTPIILAKPQADRGSRHDSPDIPHQSNQQNRGGHPEGRQLLCRKDSVPVQKQQEDRRRIEQSRPQSSEKVLGSNEKKEPSNVGTQEVLVPPRNVKLIDDNQFCDALADYMTENNDFIVLGMIGMQSVGKSLILNNLIKPHQSNSQQQQTPDEDETNSVNGNIALQRMFRVQTFEKQMLSEHCTNGVNAWISPGRILYLDSQPLFSNSVLDRSAQLEKKYSFEFNGAENTAEVHSMQLMGLFMSICHVVFVVQEGSACDTELIEKLKLAELLRPSSMASQSFDEPDKLAEYSPEIVFVHNKLNPTEMNSITKQRLQNAYEELLGQENFNFRWKSHVANGEQNLVLLPDLQQQNEFAASMLQIKRILSRLHLRPFANTGAKSEKMWFQHAKKSWDQIKTSGFYMEYSRLLRKSV